MARMGLSLRFVSLFLVSLAVTAFADTIPECLVKKGQPLAINNDQVLNWIETTKNQYQDRGHVKGTLVKAYSDKTHHHHWQVQIGVAQADTIEVIYNEDFGGVPSTVKVGSMIEACGDYITSNAQSGPYPPSPDGAIVHWVHMSPNPNHLSGFLVVDGTVCGQMKAPR